MLENSDKIDYMRWPGCEPPGYSHEAPEAETTLCLHNLSCHISHKDLKRALMCFSPIAVLKSQMSCYGIAHFKNLADAAIAMEQLQVFPRFCLFSSPTKAS